MYNYRLSILVLISAVLITISLFIFQPLRASTKELETNNLPIVLDPSLKVEVVVKGLDKPTQMAFLGNDDFLVLEKNQGTVRRVINNTLLNEPVIDVKVATAMERGLLGLAISKNHYASDNKSNAENNNSTKIFLFFTESKEDGNDHCPHITYCVPGNDPLGNRLYSYDLEGNHAVNPHLLLDLPATPGADHIGGVIKIGPDKNLYLVSGDGDSCADISSNYKMIYRCKGNNLEGSVLKSQTSNIHNGSFPTGRGGILRITQDGDVVGNPILGNKDPLDKYYAYGIRNSFGMDFDPITGKLWDTENGAGFGDEINLVEPGFNSGWLKIQGMWPVPDYNPVPNHNGYFYKDLKFNAHDLVDFNGKGIYSDPELVWNETTGPTALLFFNSDKLGRQYENDLFVGDVDFGRIYHFELNKDRTGLDLHGVLADKIVNNRNEIQDTIFAKQFGKITDMRVGPDGYLYVLSYVDGTVYRIVPNAK